MNIITTLSLFILLSLFAFKSFCQNNNYDSTHRYSVEELQTDLTFLRTTLEKTHPGLSMYSSKASLNLFFDSLYKSITGPLTAAAFYNLITLLHSKIMDGHTMLLPGEQATDYFNKNAKFFPFYVVVLNGKLFVNMNCSADTLIKEGAEILSINGTGARDIINFLLERQIRDGYNQTYPTWILTNYFKEYFSFSFGHPSSFLIAYKTGYAVEQVTLVNALSKDSTRFYKQARYAKRLAAANDKQGIILDINSQANTATLTIKSFDSYLLKSTYNQDFKSSIQRAFFQIEENKIGNLIVDIRNNQGGDFEPGRLLLSYLLNQPIEYLKQGEEFRTLIPQKNSFKGSLYILVNGGTFSNSGIVSSYLQLTKRGVFIGEETAGNRNVICGDPSDFILPNTKIAAEVSSKKYVIRDEPNDGHGVIPDYIVTASINDIITGKDTAKELALKLISNNK